MSQAIAVKDLLHLSAKGTTLLESKAQTTKVSEQQIVIHKGQQVSGAYLVAAGQLRVFTYTPQGKEATLYLINPGESCMLALNCLFNDLRYPAWVEAKENTEIITIPGATYRTLFTFEESIQNLTVNTLSTVVFRLMDELEQIHSYNLDQRLANLILTHATDDGVLNMTQQVIAGHLGTTREVIAKLMSGFVEKRVVSTRRGKVIIEKAEALAEMVKPR